MLFLEKCTHWQKFYTAARSDKSHIYLKYNSPGAEQGSARLGELPGKELQCMGSHRI